MWTILRPVLGPPHSVSLIKSQGYWRKGSPARTSEKPGCVLFPHQHSCNGQGGKGGAFSEASLSGFNEPSPHLLKEWHEQPVYYPGVCKAHSWEVAPSQVKQGHELLSHFCLFSLKKYLTCLFLLEKWWQHETYVHSHSRTIPPGSGLPCSQGQIHQAAKAAMSQGLSLARAPLRPWTYSSFLHYVFLGLGFKKRNSRTEWASGPQTP